MLFSSILMMSPFTRNNVVIFRLFFFLLSTFYLFPVKSQRQRDFTSLNSLAEAQSSIDGKIMEVYHRMKELQSQFLASREEVNSCTEDLSHIVAEQSEANGATGYAERAANVASRKFSQASNVVTPFKDRRLLDKAEQSFIDRKSNLTNLAKETFGRTRRQTRTVVNQYLNS